MKTIHMIRHAKSCWEDVSLPDEKRPLNKRGKRAAKLMSSHIHAAGCNFEHVFVSSAVRAQSTIKLIHKTLVNVDFSWQVAPRLYTFSSIELLHWLQELDDTVTEVVIVGHNPAFTDLCNLLSGAEIDNIPTCGYVRLYSHRPLNWANTEADSFELTRFIRPKQLLLANT